MIKEKAQTILHFALADNTGFHNTLVMGFEFFLYTIGLKRIVKVVVIIEFVGIIVTAIFGRRIIILSQSGGAKRFLMIF